MSMLHIGYIRTKLRCFSFEVSNYKNLDEEGSNNQN